MTETKTQQTKEFIKSIAIAIIIAVLFRSFLYEPFYIPSGSMKSNLLVGDYIFVSKYSYGYSRYSLPYGVPIIKDRIFNKQPKRGDVIVFKYTSNPKINYIKRLIGVGGDTVQMKNGQLFLNGQPIPKERVDNFIDIDKNGNRIEIPRYLETLPNGKSYYVLDQYKNANEDNTDIFTVPDGHYFFMGDNRDNSQDSRWLNEVGYVPEENLVGKANIIFFSASESILKFWKIFSSIRPERLFSSINKSVELNEQQLKSK